MCMHVNIAGTGTGDANQEGDQDCTDKVADGGKSRAGRGKREAGAGAGGGRGIGRGRGAGGRGGGDAGGNKPAAGARNAATATGRGYNFVAPGQGMPHQPPDAPYQAYGAPGGYPPPHLRGNFQPHGFAAPGGHMAGFPPAGMMGGGGGGAPHNPFMGAPGYHNGPLPPAHGGMMHMQGGEHGHGAPPYMQPFGGNMQMHGFGGNAPPQQAQNFGQGHPYMQGQAFGQPPQQQGYPHNNGYAPGRGW
jgi:hypothetical protein